MFIVFRVLLSLILFFGFISVAEGKVRKPIAYAPASPSATTYRSVAPVSTARITDPLPKTAIGFEGGIGLGQAAVTESGTAFGGTSSRNTFAGGVFFDFPASAYFVISPELLYLSKGVTTNGTEFRFDFVELPVLAKIHFATGGFRPYFFAGPSIGIPLSKKSVAPDGTSSNVDGGGLVDLSAQVGLGSEIALGGNVGLVLSGRYIHGFTDQTTNANQTIHNRTMLFMAGFRVGL